MRRKGEGEGAQDSRGGRRDRCAQGMRERVELGCTRGSGRGEGAEGSDKGRRPVPRRETGGSTANR